MVNYAFAFSQSESGKYKRVKGYLRILVVTPGVVTPDVPDGVLVCLALGVGLTIRPGEP